MYVNIYINICMHTHTYTQICSNSTFGYFMLGTCISYLKVFLEGNNLNIANLKQ